MAGDTVITVIGNITEPAQLRVTPSGASVANFTVASTARTFDKQANTWRDADPLFLRCNVWRDMAEHVAETLDEKGMRVVVQGRLRQRSYEKDGQKRTVYELEVDEVGPSLRWATAKVQRIAKTDGGGFDRGRQSGAPQGGGASWDDEPPF